MCVCVILTPLLKCSENLATPGMQHIKALVLSDLHLFEGGKDGCVHYPLPLGSWGKVLGIPYHRAKGKVLRP